MKQTVIISFLVLISLTTFGQEIMEKHEDAYYSISKLDCEYPRQTGRLEIIRNDTLSLTTYRTDSAEMILYEEVFLGFLTGFDNYEEAEKIYNQQDSLISMLFLKGLLTPELLIKAFNTESKYVNYIGDTLDLTRHQKTDYIKLLNVRIIELPEELKDEKGNLMIEIWLTFDPEESGWGPFPMYHFNLKSDIEPTDTNINEFLKNVRHQCLKYVGMKYFD
ncbi:MAG: hypothetical protein GX587_02770 [Bacteroidales bacterium]|nr:hypothetical protein [Bacteroidales bacterium]